MALAAVVTPDAAVQAATLDASAKAAAAEAARKDTGTSYVTNQQAVKDSNDAYKAIHKLNTKVDNLAVAVPYDAAKHNAAILKRDTDKPPLEIPARAGKVPASELDTAIEKGATAAKAARESEKSLNAAREQLKPVIATAVTAQKDAVSKAALADEAVKKAQSGVGFRQSMVDQKQRSLDEIAKKLVNREKIQADRTPLLENRKLKLPPLEKLMDEAKELAVKQSAVLEPLAKDVTAKKAQLQDLQQELQKNLLQAKALDEELAKTPVAGLEDALKKAQAQGELFAKKLKDFEEDSAKKAKLLADALVAKAQSAKPGVPVVGDCPAPLITEPEIDQLRKDAEAAAGKLPLARTLAERSKSNVDDALQKLSGQQLKASDLGKLKSAAAALEKSLQDGKGLLQDAEKKALVESEKLKKLELDLADAKRNLENEQRQIATAVRKFSDTDQEIKALKEEAKELTNELQPALTELKDANTLLAAELVKQKDADSKLVDANKELARLNDIDKKAGEAQDKAKKAADEGFETAARMYDFVDGAHMTGRHGPQLNEAALTGRLKDGKIDGKFAPTRESSKFTSNEDSVTTREAGKKKAAALAVQDLTKAPPALGPKSIASGNLPHKTGPPANANKVVGKGYTGTGAPQPLNYHGKTGSGYDTFNGPADQTKTKTQLDYDPYQERWKVAQHTPVN